MFIEEKRYSYPRDYMNPWDKRSPHIFRSFKLLDYFLYHVKETSKEDTTNYYKLYKGFHLIQFENTNPEDGLTKLDGKLISKDNLIKFLRFEMEGDMYKSFIKFDF